MKTQIVRIIVFVAVMLGLVCIAGAAKVPFNVLPVESYAYGKSLTDWTEIYWRWYMTGEAPSYSGPVMLMPLPAGDWISGTGAPNDPAYLKGQIEVTLKPGTPFVLPFFGFIGERFKGTDNCDPMIPNTEIQSRITNLDANGPPVITLDGQRIVTNFWDYYVGPEEFEPIIVYDTPGDVYDGACAFQGTTIIMAPLKPGTHVLTLLEKYVYIPGDEGFVLIYDNTWIITVKPTP